MRRTVGYLGSLSSITMANPWDVPPRPASYCSTSEELYAAIGEALSGWGYVEDIIADIFAIIVEGA